MSMRVTYKCFNKNGKIVIDKEEAACFSAISNPAFNNFNIIEIKIKSTNKTKAYINYWLDLMKEIEPKIEYFINDEDRQKWVRLPYDKNYHGKMLIFVTTLRYLWHSDCHLDDIVIMTKRITKIFPNMDKLKAVLIANSITAHSDGWNHSLVNSMASNLKNIWHYRRYKGTTVMGLASKRYDGSSSSQLGRLRKEKKDRYDVIPALKYYNLID